MPDNTLYLFLIAGWIFAPLAIELIPMIVQAAYALIYFRKRAKVTPEHSTALPRVTVIVPVYNGQNSISLCLSGLMLQNYPTHLLEIIVVDDGSGDNTAAIVQAHIEGKQTPYVLKTLDFEARPQQFKHSIQLIRRERGNGTINGKSAALNSVLKIATGEIIITIDDDSVLAPDAIEKAILAFCKDDTLLAASGRIMIDPHLAVCNHADGTFMLDDAYTPKTKSFAWLQGLLIAFETLEYLYLAGLDRPSNAASNRMFTLSGAFALYRREALLAVGGFQNRTLGEDTDINLCLHRIPKARTGFLYDARVYITPMMSWTSLKSQRMRWYRAAIENLALHLPHKPDHNPYFWHIYLPVRWLMLHTLLIPRVLWLGLMLILPLLGAYHWQFVLNIFIILTLIYSVMSALQFAFIYYWGDATVRQLIKRYGAAISLMMFYHVYLYIVHMISNISFFNAAPRWQPD